MKLRQFLPFLIALSAFAMPDKATAGLININLTDTAESETGMDGDAILGGGTWNRIDKDQATTDTPLVDSEHNPTGITAKDTVVPSPIPQNNGNQVQNVAWGFDVNLTVSGLIVDQVYKVAVYSDRYGTLSPSDTYVVNGVDKQLPNPQTDGDDLPGIENTDYALFTVNASGTGNITIEAPWIAGIQIEGVLPGEAGPQPDARVSDKASKAGKGNDRYASSPRRSQTLSQNTRKKRPRRFFLWIENDGEEVDRFSLRGRWSKRKSRVKVIALGGGGNVTAETLSGIYRYQLCRDEARQFKIVVKPKRKKRRTLKARFEASPSTGAAARKDLVVTKTRVRP